MDKDPLGTAFKKPCQHKSEKTKFRCASLSRDIILRNRHYYFANKTKIDQDKFLATFLSTYEPVRRDKVPPKMLKNRQVSCTYYLWSRKKKAVQVCKKFFMAVFSVTEKRLRLLNQTLVKGNMPKENRGGDHRSHKTIERKEKVRQFLNGLPAKESHYNRQKSKRIYLSTELNVRKLINLYNSTVSDDLKVRPGMFYKIFHGEYNIGFATPSSDVCNTCVLLSNQIKAETNPEKKMEIMTQKRIHKLRANAFYEIMKRDISDSISLCFDLQQVLPLPKTPIQDAFYSRQISLYNFCVYNLNTKKATFFVWDETQASRGAVEIGSALYYYLTSLRIPENVKVLRFFCDGCGGQNKNSFIIHTMIQWLYSKSPKSLMEIQLHFPVRGHSFLPADRVFGRIEKNLKRIPVITKKEEYIEQISQHGDVQNFGEKWNLEDIKSLSQDLKKLEGIQKMKRIYIAKKTMKSSAKVLNCTVTAYETFKFSSGTEQARSLLKQGRRIPLDIPGVKSTSIPLTANKKKDVENLLTKQFGENWKSLDELAWYNSILNEGDHVAEGVECHECDEDVMCLCNEPDVDVLKI